MMWSASSSWRLAGCCRFCTKHLQLHSSSLDLYWRLISAASGNTSLFFWIFKILQFFFIISETFPILVVALRPCPINWSNGDMNHKSKLTSPWDCDHGLKRPIRRSHQERQRARTWWLQSSAKAPSTKARLLERQHN